MVFSFVASGHQFGWTTVESLPVTSQHFAPSSGNEQNHNGGVDMIQRDEVCSDVTGPCRSVGRIWVGSLYADVGAAESETAVQTVRHQAR